MAQYDSADLLARYKWYEQRPATDDSETDPDRYRLLSEAQVELMAQVAGMGFAETQYAAPFKLATADGGLTYTFGNDADGNAIAPIGTFELRESRTGPVMLPCADWDTQGDYLFEGTLIRFPSAKQRTFADGPYCRGIVPPTQISASVQPVLRPAFARILIVYRALQLWCARGGLRDPSPFKQLEDQAWYGDPMKGNYGILGMFQKQAMLQGAAAQGAYEGDWWHYISLGTSRPQ